MFSLASWGNAQEVDSVWRLRVDDLQHAVKIDATIRFTDEPANSCMSGGWKRIVVETTSVVADNFFPLSSPLAYKLEGNSLTVGRTDTCDGYLFLQGRRASTAIEGTYDAVGWGSKRLGAFSLQKMKSLSYPRPVQR